MRTLAFVALLVLSLAASRADASDFQNISWGMTPAQVARAYRGVHLRSTGNQLTADSVQVAGRPAMVVFTFRDGTLRNISVAFLGSGRFDFSPLAQSLSKKYGSPASKDESPNGAIALRWKTPRSYITLEMPSRGVPSETLAVVMLHYQDARPEAHQEHERDALVEQDL